MRRYCPKCGIKMKRIKVSSNSTEFLKLIRKKKYYQCPSCNGVLMK